MIPLLQGLIVLGGLIIALGAHVFLGNNPAEEQVAEEMAEEIVQVATHIDIAPMEKVVDAVADVFDGKENK